jgi:hypothetical protein
MRVFGASEEELTDRISFANANGAPESILDEARGVQAKTPKECCREVSG